MSGVKGKSGVYPRNEYHKQINRESHKKTRKDPNTQGYILIHKPDHPFATKAGYVREHRLVIEQQINRYLLPKEESHHLNDIRDDNRPENLMAFRSQSAHQRFHKNPDNVKLEEIIFDGRNKIV